MYATLADLKAYIPNITGTGADALLTDCLKRAQAAIERYCERTFEASTDTTRHFDAMRDVESVTLMVDRDLCQITSIVNGDGATLSASDYTTQPRNETPWFAIKLKLSSGRLWMFNTDPEDAISVTGRWAYSVQAPDDIVHACIRLAGYYYKLRDSQVFDTTVMPDKGQIIIPKGLPQDVKFILEPYRRLI